MNINNKGRKNIGRLRCNNYFEMFGLSRFDINWNTRWHNSKRQKCNYSIPQQ